MRRPLRYRAGITCPPKPPFTCHAGEHSVSVEHFDRCAGERGDFLFTRYNGSAHLVGVGALYLDGPRYYPDQLIRVRLWPELQDYARYFEIVVNTWVSRKHIAANIKTTAGQQGLSGEALKNTPIPLPPRAEVAAIIRAIDDVDNDAAADLASIARAAPPLRQSVLKAAFEGRLINPDPHDEPAEHLLARLNDDRQRFIPASRRAPVEAKA